MKDRLYMDKKGELYYIEIVDEIQCYVFSNKQNFILFTMDLEKSLVEFENDNRLERIG